MLRMKRLVEWLLHNVFLFTLTVSLLLSLSLLPLIHSHSFLLHAVPMQDPACELPLIVLLI